tara:strand:+ start:777 stop:1439 length:663 start_codon:yes stop_codon:yes gene_type:complete
MQRIFDILLSLTAIIFLSPILVPVVFILKMTGEGEIFYKQKRVGIHGAEFNVLKFATMLKNSPNIGSGEITLKNDPRVLPFGKFLRKSKINELPQLFNILFGEMSVVGPRPMVPNTYSFYDKFAQDTLNKIRPGLTGIGSIIFRDEEKFLENKKDPIDFYRKNIIPYKSSLEIWYVDNLSLIMYFKCILSTALIVAFPQTRLHLKFFKGLPEMPNILKQP